MRKYIISILGGNNKFLVWLWSRHAFGKAIIDEGWLLCTGGRSGIMEVASKGERTRICGLVIKLGVLPDATMMQGMNTSMSCYRQVLV